MSDPPKDDDEKRRDEILKRMLKTPPKPHKTGTGPKPDTHGSEEETDEERDSPEARGDVNHNRHR